MDVNDKQAYNLFSLPLPEMSEIINEYWYKETYKKYSQTQQASYWRTASGDSIEEVDSF